MTSTEQLVILSPEEHLERLQRLQQAMQQLKVDSLLISDNANLFYLTGRVYAGYAFVPAVGEPMWFVRRPVDLTGGGVTYIRKPEDMPAHIQSAQIDLPRRLGLELDILPYNQAIRLGSAFEGAEVADISALLKQLRSVKTDYEVEQMRRSGVCHERVYRRIPGLYRSGMTDLELQIEIERVSRLEGCLGMFRISGQSMEIYMGNVLTGKNADEPAPYDFAMGGRGLHPSIPGGASGEIIKPHKAVMIDLNGNFTGYMTDMTRVFAVDKLPQEAIDAHQCSIEICRMFEREALPGVEARVLYERAVEIVRSHNLERHFMGHRQHAGFIGHGVGIEVNEWPVIAPRSRQILEANNTIALEPKFVLPEVGAVGIENTYLITSEGAQSLTNAPEEIVQL